MSDKYLFGSADITPHIHVYSSGGHVKMAGGKRDNLVVDNVRVLQSKLHEAFEHVRTDYPNNHDTGTLLIAAMRNYIRPYKQHKDDIWEENSDPAGGGLSHRDRIQRDRGSAEDVEAQIAGSLLL